MLQWYFKLDKTKSACKAVTCKETVLYLGGYRSAGACLEVEYGAAARGHPLLQMVRDDRDARAVHVAHEIRAARVARAAGARVPAVRLQ